MTSQDRPLWVDEFKEEKEICFECKHTKRYHNSIHKEGACSQPTCQCSCFISSGIFYGMDLFEAYEKGKEEARRAERDKILHELPRLVEIYKDEYNNIAWDIIEEELAPQSPQKQNLHQVKSTPEKDRKDTCILPQEITGKDKTVDSAPRGESNSQTWLGGLDTDTPQETDSKSSNGLEGSRPADYIKKVDVARAINEWAFKQNGYQGCFVPTREINVLKQKLGIGEDGEEHE